MTASLVPLVVVGRRAAFLPDGGPSDAVVGDLGPVVEAAKDLERREQPRWAVTSAADLAPLLARGTRPTRCWDVAEAHRLLFGGWQADPAYAWARLRDLDPGGMPSAHPESLFDVAASPAEPDPEPDSPVAPSGYLRPQALTPQWADRPARLARLAAWVRDVAATQRQRLERLGPRAATTALSESAAALLCVELERDGLPLDRSVAERIIAGAAGPRPASPADARQAQRTRDESVLRHVPAPARVDLRNPGQVRALLASVGIDVPTTRAPALEPYRAASPLVEALLHWRKQERIATTYGYRWLDQHAADGRLRGRWSACDGAAGRMTAQNGLHNLPAALRPAVVAEAGRMLVRADLGQVEPRVLALMSGDPDLAAACRATDLYAPVAERLGVSRAVAKVAVLAAMYGQRSGPAGRVLDQLERSYPSAMGLLDRAYDEGVHGHPLRTFGGRLVLLDGIADPAARGRFARNAVIQGSAAELFKAWAATVRLAVRPLGGQLVLCLHDELLVQVPEAQAADAAAAVTDALRESSRRWAGSERVGFVADVSVVHSWDEVG